MISEKLQRIADQCAAYSLRERALEPEIMGVLALALLDISRQVSELETLPFVVISRDEP